MLSIDDTIILTTWLAYGTAGALMLLNVWDAGKARHATDDIGLPRLVIYVVLTSGGLLTLAIGLLWHLAQSHAHRRQQQDRAPRDRRAGIAPPRGFWCLLLLFALVNSGCFRPAPSPTAAPRPPHSAAESPEPIQLSKIYVRAADPYVSPVVVSGYPCRWHGNESFRTRRRHDSVPTRPTSASRAPSRTAHRRHVAWPMPAREVSRQSPRRHR